MSVGLLLPQIKEFHATLTFKRAHQYDKGTSSASWHVVKTP